jgi:hypothetical protein
MAFPFSIKYLAQLEHYLSVEKNEKVLLFIQDFIAKETAEDIVLEDDKLTFKSKFFNSNRERGNVFMSIDKGEFVLVKERGKTVLSYTFYMHNLFISTFIMSVIMGIFVQVTSNEIDMAVFVSIICFLWLCGGNWLTAKFKNKKMFQEILTAVNTLNT